MCHVIHFHVAIKLIDVEMITHYGHDGEGWPGAADITFNLNMFGQIADFGLTTKKDVIRIGLSLFGLGFVELLHPVCFH